MTRSLAVTFNALGLFAIALVLLFAFAAQLLLHELPCPLCLLQRIQFALLAVGPILNIRFGLRPSHYAVSLLTAVAGAAFAARQILLHVMPGDPGYGSALLGYHYYTWAFIGFAVAIVAIAAVDAAYEISPPDIAFKGPENWSAMRAMNGPVPYASAATAANR